MRLRSARESGVLEFESIATGYPIEKAPRRSDRFEVVQFIAAQVALQSPRMELAELLEREAVTDGDQLLDWARQRAVAVIAELGAEDSLRSLLEPGSEARVDLGEVPIARRRRREPSSPQPKTADELPPLPDHPRLADGEPEPMLEHVDTGPIDLEEEIVRRRIREDSWAIAAREVEAFVAERQLEPEDEAPIQPAIRDSDAPALRSAQPSEPELPVVVRPADSLDDPIDPAALAADLAAIEGAHDDEEEFEVDELDELEVDELVELDEEVDDEEGDDEPSAAKPPRPPPPKSGPPPIRNEVADMIASLSDPVRTGDTATTHIDQVEGAPGRESDDDDGIDIDVD